MDNLMNTSLFWSLIFSKLWKSEDMLFFEYLFLSCSCFSALWASVNGLNNGHSESNCFTNSAIAVVWDMSPRACQACLGKTTQRIIIKHDTLDQRRLVFYNMICNLVKYNQICSFPWHICMLHCNIVSKSLKWEWYWWYYHLFVKINWMNYK